VQLLKRLRGGLRFFSHRGAESRRSSLPASFDKALRGAGFPFEQWFRNSGRALSVGVHDQFLPDIRARYASLAEATVSAADEVLEHRFNLLGSGPYVPVDENGQPDASGYRPIDWYLDPVRGLRLPRGVRHTEWNLEKMRPGNADIKYPWELARCQHWPVLAQAWRLTGSASYATEIRHQLDDFRAANPVGVGVNWTCTMDVALRAANWAIGLQMVRDCPALDESFWRRAYEGLYDHGMFIFANLEDKYEVTSNHFLSNVVGLYYVATVFQALEAGKFWEQFCRLALEREMVVQVLADGADYESSVPYHRLVAELFLGACRLADWRGEPLSAAYRTKLVRMVDFLAGVLRPDGLMPQIGDADDGRLHILTRYGTWNPQDPRHLFAPAALTLGESRWLKHCGPDGGWEAAWWGFDIRATEFYDGAPPDHATLYRDAGLAIARKGGTYLAVTNGIVGTKGFGNHKHNDQLGFELHLDGQPLFVDPGSFVYTCDPAARNLFRGTGYHNTVMVDGTEQNELRPEWLFRLFETSHAEHLTFDAGAKTIQYRGRHMGYRRLSDPLVHERSFRLAMDAITLTIVDRFEGEGVHRLSWHFHLAPGVQVDLRSDREALLAAGARQYRMTAPGGLKGKTAAAWYSPSYGVRLECAALEWEAHIDTGASSTFEFLVEPVSGAVGT
jgi:hypothetical protein